MKKLLLSGAVLIAVSTAPLAATVGLTGLGLPFDNMQPSLVITQSLVMSGIYPSRDSSGIASGDTLGFVYQFAGNFSPGSSVAAQGQVLPITTHIPLFSLLGTNYGGDGRATFGLPNLSGTAVIGAGTGPGLSSQTLGVLTGTSSTSLSIANIPSHDHTLSGGGVTGSTGGGLALSNFQASLPLRTLIATSGVYPSSSGGGTGAFLGQIGTFAGNFNPSGWAEADGSLLPIVGNEALFSLIGTTYGGDGGTTFALPDLRGRLAVGADSTFALGTRSGVEATTLNLSQMPAHDHIVSGGGSTGTTGGSLAFDNIQPSLAINYLIALRGIYPSRDSGSGFDEFEPVLGQITEFAGNFAPGGWAFAHGQLLPISSNTALFSLLGTMYGGDGRTNFALPDFRLRTAIGAGGIYDVGERYGSDTALLTVANLATHDHSAPDPGEIPEPGTIALVFAGLAGVLGLARRRRT